METARPRLEHRQYRDTDNPTPPEFPETGESVDSSSTVSTSQTLPPFLWKEHAVPGTEVKYLRTTGEVDEALQSVKGDARSTYCIIAAREARPNISNPTQWNEKYVLQSLINVLTILFDSEFPKILQNILEDYKIIKAGVGISGDAKKLWRDCGVSLLGAVELSKLARVSDPSRWGDAKSSELIGLARLVEAYRSRRMLKSLKVRLSNWEQILDESQIQYAASDALAGALVYQHLLDLNPSVLPHDYTFNFLAGRPELYVRPCTIGLQTEVSGNYTSHSTTFANHHKMNVQTQIRRLSQPTRLFELVHLCRSTTKSPQNPRYLYTQSYGPVSLLARRASYPKQIPGQEGSSQLNASTTSLGLKLLGISLAGLAIHTWLLETYALDACLFRFDSDYFTVDPATSISFPTILQLDGEPKMTLLGLGVRRVSFLGINVYSVGFYADLSKVDAKIKLLGQVLRQCKSPEECINLLIQKTSCALRIVPTRATSYTHLRDGFIRTIQARQALRRKDGSLTTEQEEALHTPLQQFKGLFPTAAFKKHQPLHIVLSSSATKPRELRLHQLGTIQDDWLATEFFLAYFHGTISPPSPWQLIEDVKQNVEAIWLPNLRVQRGTSVQ
ncbi:Chalcone domain-containing protein [Rhizoctonia solani AG-1 IA]|uniref:Chalcone domain-containing protein n=1 Tax=Thanatephorus cucumeris (strain AG1-IA) TaxID=983506 RepID=L8X5Y0_THACA|nr:Chalcone domain-containing protein [Rhizoctonia solani AG-1 IA]